MKLKKIASLALAGIMAVSMLAGCKDGGNSNSGSSSENTNTATGVSAEFYGYLSQASQNLITLSDDSKVDAALEKVVAGLSESEVNAYYTSKWNAGYVGDLSNKMAAVDVLDCKTTLQAIKNDTDKAVTTVNVFVNGKGMPTSTFLKAVAESTDGIIAAFPTKGGKDVTNEYTYTGSVSVTSTDFVDTQGVTRTVSFIALSITQTPTKISNTAFV